MYKEVMKMELVLNQLYRGEIHPEERYRPVMPELIELRKSFIEYRDALLNELDGKTKGKLLELLEERTFVSSYEIEDAYVQDMTLGARMAVSLLKEENKV